MECDVVPSLANMTVTSLVSFFEFLLFHRKAKLIKLAITPIDEGLPSVSDFYKKIRAQIQNGKKFKKQITYLLSNQYRTFVLLLP